jgi:hypothetical protein
MSQSSKDNAVIFTGENEFRDVTIKGINAQTITKGEVLMYDVSDDTYITYSGATGKIPTAIYAGETITLATGALTKTRSVCVAGDVDEDEITISSGDAIDDAPNSAAYSIREYLRQWGIRVYDYKDMTS